MSRSGRRPIARHTSCPRLRRRKQRKLFHCRLFRYGLSWCVAFAPPHLHRQPPRPSAHRHRRSMSLFPCACAPCRQHNSLLRFFQYEIFAPVHREFLAFPPSIASRGNTTFHRGMSRQAPPTGRCPIRWKRRWPKARPIPFCHCFPIASTILVPNRKPLRNSMRRER